MILVMPEILLSTQFKARGPWLLDLPQLESLEGLVKRFIAERQEIHVDYPSPTKTDNSTRFSWETNINIQLCKNRQLQAKSFREAAQHPLSQDETAIGFTYEVKYKTL